jgi:hypothetical protein
MSHISETKAQLQEGINRLTEASVPLEDGRSNAERLQHEVDERHTALRGILGYFAGLNDRIELEVNRPFGEAHAKYEEAQGLIIPAVQGSEKTAAQAATYHVTRLEEKARKDIPLPDGYIGPNIRGALSALEEAISRVKEIEYQLLTANTNTRLVQQQHHDPAITATLDFKDSL